jgi:ssDNA-binding Zn-finger/Zn-ribbon topoisomerase 1
MKLSDITFQKVYSVTCPKCNENIVERSDERDVDTLLKAKSYAKNHYETEHKPYEDQAQRIRADAAKAQPA